MLKLVFGTDLDFNVLLEWVCDSGIAKEYKDTFGLTQKVLEVEGLSISPSQSQNNMKKVVF